MRQLHVDPAGVRLLAARCRAWAADLAAPALPECESFPATAAAVAAVHRILRTTAGSLAHSMGETADLIEEAAGHFQAADAWSAGALHGITTRA